MKEGTQRLPIGVLISGSGTNLQSIIEHCKMPDFPAEVKVVISNKYNAYGLERAHKHNIPSFVVESKPHTNKEEFEAQIIAILKKYKVELVCLAGFMKILSPHFIRAFDGRIMNIHPALLPSFPGLHAQRQALQYGVKVSGCTVHFVDEGTDTGPIILQAPVVVLEDDTEETLSARILKQEHKIYPQAIKLFAEGKLEISGRKVKIIS